MNIKSAVTADSARKIMNKSKTTDRKVARTLRKANRQIKSIARQAYSGGLIYLHNEEFISELAIDALRDAGFKVDVPYRDYRNYSRYMANISWGD